MVYSDESRLLSPREIDVLGGLCRGATNKEIGTALGICEKSVKAHVTRIFRKMGVRNRTQAALQVRSIADAVVASLPEPDHGPS